MQSLIDIAGNGNRKHYYGSTIYTWLYANQMITLKKTIIFHYYISW